MEAKISTSEKQVRSFYGSTNVSCTICHQDHRIYTCQKFANMNQKVKVEAVKLHKLCENCLVAGHIAASCRSRSSCKICHKRHHTLLHTQQEFKRKNYSNQMKNHTAMDQAKPSDKQTFTKSDTTAMSKTITHFATNFNRHQIMLATAIIKAQRHDGDFVEIRALIDQGSQATFITEDVAQRLRLQKHKVYTVVSGIGNANAGTAQTCVELTLQPRFSSSFFLNTKALILPKLTGLLPSERLSSYNWPHIKGLTLADPMFYLPGRIDMIIGADVFCQIIRDKVVKGQSGGPVAQETEFGYILSGETSTKNSSGEVQCYIAETDISKELCKFWESEELLPERIPTQEELECELHFQKTHKRDSEGRYIVRLPFRTSPSADDLEGSRELALARLFQLERRFKTNIQLEKMYKDFIKEYIQLRHMVPASDDAEVKYYLPHHAVFKYDSTTTKLRVVFDASIKRNSKKSLNELMMTGPNLQRNITSILVKWQKYKIVFIADIEKMYRQIKVDTRDQDVQRILWRESPKDPIREYKLTTVTYGTASAPFLALRTCRQLALDDGKKFPLAAKIILDDAYVDDVVSGADTIDQAFKTCTELIDLFKGGGFNLRKWNSNSTKLLEHIPRELRDQPKDLKFDDGETIKALGMHWDPKADCFTFKINIQMDPVIVTKRSILSESARIFDPIGLLAPVTVKIKLLYQQIWLETNDWDDAVSDNILEEWERIKSELPALEKIRVPRWAGYKAQSSVCELHGFSDASERAYCAVVYMRVSSSDGEITTKLLAARTKIAPLRSKLSLPRLELNGALLLARLIKETERSLEIDKMKCYAWTDSTIVLSWLRGKPHQWKTFVGNRVAEIQAIIDSNNWFHVNSENNPADLASRGVYPKSLLNNTLWWKGPKWLELKQLNPSKPVISDTNLELKTRMTACVARSMETILMEELLQRYSSLTKLQRILAYCLRFIHNLGSHKQKTGPLTAVEISNAMIPLIKSVQRKHFEEDIKRLSEKRGVSKLSRLLSLNPFLDDNSLLRVGGRLEHSAISFNQKHPIILPYKSELTTLIITSAHLTTLHGGNFKTLEYVRQRYWILNGLKAVKGHLHRCTTCHRLNASSAVQLMGNLPKPRVSVTRPFSNTGVDYAGPFTLRLSKGRGTKTCKGYVALFICLSTKAVHLEVVSDLTSQGFLAAFKRFVSRRGPVANMYSDNATNFVGASRELTEAFKKSDYQSRVFNALANEGTQWHFIPPASPHFGGLWEAGVKATKHHMKRIIGETILTYEELTTLITMIEACLNSRPLCPLNNDPENLDVLTPGHFLIGSPLLTIPQENFLEKNPNLLTRWHILDRMHQGFWKRWSSEYLSRLQQRPKWAQRQPNIKEGNIVLIKEENLPPTKWALGRVIQTYTGNDGLVRVVDIKTKTSTIKRPVTKVSLLPIVDNEEDYCVPEQPSLEDQQFKGDPQTTAAKSSNQSCKQPSKRKGKQSQPAPKKLRGSTETKPLRHSTPSNNRFTKANLALFSVIFGLLLIFVSAEKQTNSYTVSQFDQKEGIYFEMVADANIYNNEWTLLVHFDLTTYWNQLETMERGVSQLRELCEKVKERNDIKNHCSSMITQLKHQLLEVGDANQLIKQQNGRETIEKKKRAAMLGLVGQVAHSLFGVLDEEFAENYERDITSLRSNENHLKELLQKQTSIADSTINIIKKGQTEVLQQFLAIKSHMTAMETDLNRAEQGLQFAEMFNSAAFLILLELENIRHIQTAILSVVTDTRHGKINPLLLTPTQLKNQLRLIRQHLPRNLKIPEDLNGNLALTLYSLMQVRTRITSNNALFEITIPLLDAEYYKIYYLTPIPMINADKFVYIQPSSQYLLVNNHRDRYSPMEESDLATCRTWNQNHLLCKLTLPMYNLRANVSRCEMDLLTLENKLSPRCNLKTAPKRSTWTRMHTANSWIFVLERETTFDIVCGTHFEQATLAGSGVLQLRSNCLMKHSSMVLTTNSKVTEAINSSFIMNVNIPSEFLSASRGNTSPSDQFPTIDKDVTFEDLANVHAMIEDQKQEIKAMSKVNGHDLHHYASTYILIAIGFSLAILYYVKHNRKVAISNPTPDTVELESPPCAP